jgi:hypothetical protein
LACLIVVRWTATDDDEDEDEDDVASGALA